MAKHLLQPGHKKFGGRQKGSLNKRTVAKALLQVDEVLIANGVKPIEELLKLIPLLEPRDQVKTYLELQSYIQGKPRMVDVVETTPEVSESTQIATEELLQIVRKQSA